MSLPTVRPSSPARVLALALLCSWAGTAQAHDTSTSWTIVRLRPAELELTVTIAAEAVWPAVQSEEPAATFAMEQLEALRPLLVRCAQHLHAAQVADKPLLALRGDVRVVEDYLVFSAVYARPAGGLLQLKAKYLSKVSPEFTAEVSILDASGALLLEQSLTAEQPALELTLPDEPVSKSKVTKPRRP